MGNNSKRINLVLPASTVSRIEKLKDKTDAASATEVIRSAILVYETVVEHIATGHTLHIKKIGENQFHQVQFVLDVSPKTV